MSSYWCGYYGTALVLTEKEYSEFITRYAKANQKEPEEIEEDISDFGIREYSFIRSDSRLMDSRTEDHYFHAVDVFTDDCEGMRLFPLFVGGKPNTYEDIGRNMIVRETNENLYVFFSDRSMTSPYVFAKPAYASYDELVSEYKGKLRDYLPDDFQWDLHIGMFSYAAYA